MLLAAYNCNAPKFTPSDYIRGHAERKSVTSATLENETVHPEVWSTMKLKV
jgi:hypothetical protein